MALVVLNARAGGGRADRLAQDMADWLHRHHPHVSLRRTVSVQEARRHRRIRPLLGHVYQHLASNRARPGARPCLAH